MFYALCAIDAEGVDANEYVHYTRASTRASITV